MSSEVYSVSAVRRLNATGNKVLLHVHGLPEASIDTTQYQYGEVLYMNGEDNTIFVLLFTVEGNRDFASYKQMQCTLEREGPSLGRLTSGRKGDLAVMKTGQTFSRVVIVEEVEARLFRVYSLDEGSVREVPLRSLHRLSSNFFLFPPLAIPVVYKHSGDDVIFEEQIPLHEEAKYRGAQVAFKGKAVKDRIGGYVIRTEELTVEEGRGRGRGGVEMDVVPFDEPKAIARSVELTRVLSSRDLRVARREQEECLPRLPPLGEEAPRPLPSSSSSHALLSALVIGGLCLLFVLVVVVAYLIYKRKGTALSERHGRSHRPPPQREEAPSPANSPQASARGGEGQVFPLPYNSIMGDRHHEHHHQMQREERPPPSSSTRQKTRPASTQTPSVACTQSETARPSVPLHSFSVDLPSSTAKGSTMMETTMSSPALPPTGADSSRLSAGLSPRLPIHSTLLSTGHSIVAEEEEDSDGSMTQSVDNIDRVLSAYVSAPPPSSTASSRRPLRLPSRPSLHSGRSLVASARVSSLLSVAATQPSASRMDLAG